MIEHIYCWYHHMAVGQERANWINQKIEEHDWVAYCIARELFDSELSPYKKTEDGQDLLYFPDSIFKWSGEGDDRDCEVLELTEETFKLITGAECECG